MKKFKKIMAVLVAAIMVVAMTVPAWAATISVEQDAATGKEGAETYLLYKIFDVSKKTSGTGNTTDSTVGKDLYSEAGTYTTQQTYDDAVAQYGTLYTKNGDRYTRSTGYNNGTTYYYMSSTTGLVYTIESTNNWFTVLGTANGDSWTAAGGQEWVTLTKTTVKSGLATVYNVTWNDEKYTQKEAEAFAEWLFSKKGDISRDYELTSGSGGVASTINADDGYYLITSSLGTKLILATSDITISTKNDYVSTEKTADKTNLSIGDIVTYTITVDLPATTDYTHDVTVHDTISNVLSVFTSKYNASSAPNGWTATYKETGSASDAVDFSSHVTLDTVVNEHDAAKQHKVSASDTGYDFVLDIDSLAPANRREAVAYTITITYKAELTSSAEADNAYKNKELVEYSKYYTAPDDADVVTYDFDMEKTDGENVINGAVFELRTSADNAQTAIEFIRNKYYTDATYLTESNESTLFTAAVGTAKKADTDDTDKTTKIVAGDLNVTGLGQGTYYLVETTAPAGYRKLEAPYVITIAADGGYTITYKGQNIVTAGDTRPDFDVVNKTDAVLPSTGGMGTTVLYIVGGMLVILAGAYLFFSRKRTA